MEEKCQKKLKLSGQEYVSRTNKIVAKKTVKETDCSKCRFQCNDKIPDNVRQEIFDSYYSLGSNDRQMDFIASMVESVTPARSKGKRKASNQYNLMNDKRHNCYF